MKKRLLTTSWMMLLASVFAITMMAQQTVIIQVNTAGGLWDAVEAQGITDFTSVKNLTVTGKIGDDDFGFIKNQLSNLESIDISGTNIKEIPNQAFSGKENLKTVRLPEGITNMNYSAFENCQQLESVTFGSQTAVKGQIVFPSSLCNLDWNVFYNCYSLTNLDFSACTNLGTINSSAFGNLINLKDVIFPSQGNLRIEWNCFNVDYNIWDEATQQWFYKGLESMTLTKAVTYLSGYCLPRTLKTLYVESSTPPECNDETFNNILETNNSIKVYVPKGSKRKYGSATGWAKLYQYMEEMGIQINISGYGTLQQGSRSYSNGNVFFANQGSATTLKLVPDYNNEWKTVKLDGNTLSIAADGTFTIPAGTTIGTLDVAFTTNMIAIDNPNGGELSKKITDLGLNPKTIHTLKVTGKVNSADWTVISNLMKALEAIDLSETNIQEIPNDAFRENSYLQTCRMPENVKYLRNAAFYNCRNLKTISFGNLDDNVFPSSLIRIEDSVFSGCSLIEKADLSTCILLETLDNYCFNNCTSLKDVILPKDGNFGIGWEAFKYSGLTTFTLTKAVNSLRCGFLPDKLKVLYIESSTPLNTEGTCCFENLDLTNLSVYVPKGSKNNYVLHEHWSFVESNIQELGFQVNISGFGSLQKGNATYSNGDVFFANQGSATTLKLVPDKDNEWLAVKLDGNTLSIAADGTFTIPAGTTIGTLDISFTNNMLTIDNSNGGQLKDKVVATGITPSTIRAIKVVGTMTAKDWSFVKNNMTSLEAFDISGTNLKTIPESAFQDHQKLTTIHLPSTITSIGSWAFQNCQHLTTITGCENVEEIGERTFQYCYKLTNFPFGNKIRSLSSAVFENCSSLPETLVMPASLNSMWWDNIFNGSSIRSFDLSLCTLYNSLQYNTFGKCTSLLLPEKGDYQLNEHALEDAQLIELRIPTAVSSINYDHVLPATLERLYVTRTEPINVNDNNAFANIDFNNCTLYVPVGSKDAYEMAMGWSDFTNIVEQGIKVNIIGFGSVVQGNISYSNGDVFFANQSSATTLKLVPDYNNEWLTVKLDGNTLSIAADGTFTIPAGTTIGTLDVSFTSNMLTIENPNGGELKEKIAATGITPSTIRAIKVVGTMAAKDWTFVKSNMPALEEFDISETNLKTIPESAFQDHQKLTTIHLPSTVTSIGNMAFYSCPQLTTVYGCEGVKEIGSNAFGYCSKLSVFPFGDAIQKIECRAFEYCSSLPATLVMPSSLTNLSCGVFFGSSVLSFDLSLCTLTGSIWDNTFGECTSLVLPEKGDYCFDCNALKDAHLTELRLPSAVNGLVCENALPTTLERLYVSRTEPISWMADNAFNNLDFNNCTLYVPVGSKEAYETAMGWSNFTNVKEYGMTVVVGEEGKVHADGHTLMGTTTFFPKGNTATFEIVPNAGWHADAVTLNGDNIAFANNKFTLSGDQLSGTLAISFAINQFKLELQIAGNGKVKVGSQEYTTNQILTVDSLTTLNLTLEPADGQMVSAITFNGQESVVQNGGKTYVTPAIVANSTLAITFGTSGAIGNVVTYTVNTGEGGTVEYKNTTLLSPQTTILVPKGQDAVFEMKPNQYYVVDAVKLNNQDVTSELDSNGKLTVKNITADAKLEVTFRINAEITVIMEDGGTLTNMLTNALKQKVTKLIVKGPINEQDFYTMRDEMPLLAKIDLWEAQTEYIPSQAFCTNQSWDNSIGKKSLTNVRLPKTTRWIGDFSFAGCSNLKEVNFTELKNLEEIYSRAFAWTALNVIDLSQTKLTYVNSEFYQVKNLKNIIFPQTITRLGDVFRGSSVTEIDLSNYTNLKTLEGTFSECRDLVKVTLPEGLTIINWSFNGCEKLTTINLPKSLQVIGGSAFSNTKLQKIDLSGLTELQSIDGSAFSGCYELNEILFPTSLEQIGDNAFSSCNKLTSVDLSNTQLLSISEWTFSGCYNLESVKMPKTLETIGNYAFESCNKLSGNLELTSGITRIGDYAFAGTQISIIRSEATVPPALSSNSMPESWVAAFVPEGSADAYKKATVWKDKWIIDKEVYAEVTVRKEGNLAVDIKDQTHIAQPTITHLKVHGPLGPTDFEIMRSNMTLLYDLDMSDAEVTVIPEKAFLNKTMLMNVKLPASLRTIESAAFQGCSALDGSLALPDGLRLIGWSAFQGCSSLDEVVLNESLEAIQGYAFEGCSSLKQEITLPRDFQSLGEHAFANCSSLYGTVKFNRDFYMFMGTEGYGSSTGYCFENCSNIETVDMSEPDFLDEIPYYTFANCTSLKTVLLPQNLDRIDNGAFSNCTSLDNIEFPNTLLVINWGAFQNCTSLSSLNLSDCKNLGTIEGHAFEGCSNLETVYLPKSLNWIGEYAFRDCRNLSNLTVEAVQPADLGDYVFDKVKTDRCILSIPTGTYDDYLTAPQWGAFVDMHKNIDVTVGDGANLYVVNDEPNTARGTRRTSATELQGAKVKDGSSLYVQENETAIFKVNPDENVEIAKVLFNGKDVTSEMVNGVYETPEVTAASSFEVQVNVLGDLHVKELRMLDDNVTIKVAEKRQLRFAVYPTNATNQAITWTSSNEKVATVNSDGIITGVAAGSVEITGKTIDGGLEKKCQVVITPNKYWLVTEGKVEEDIERSVRLPLALHNEDEARDIQFDVWTPENMYLNEWDIELNSGRTSGHIVSTERISNKVMRVKVSSPTGGKFKNSDGELLTLSFGTGSKGGDYDVAIRNVHITGPNNFDFTVPDHTIRFSMPSYPMGDSNGDGKVTINDAVNTIDYILGRGNERFFWNLTNVNKDGDITVADITGIIDIILERPSHAKAARKTANNAQGRLYLNDISMTAGKQQTIGLQMENAADFIAFQCDIYLPTGMEIAYDKNGNALVSLAGGVTSHHTISANMLDNGALRVIVMSPQNERLSILENDIVNLSVTTESTMVGDGVIDIRDIRLVRSSDHSEYLAPNASAFVHFGEPTAIDKLMASKGLKMRMEDHYLIINAETAMTLPLVSANGISKELQIHKGENRFFIENTGVYIIGGNKLIVK